MWLLHTVTGLILITYILVQICVVGLLAAGEQVFNRVIEKLHSPLVLVLEMLFVASLLFHSFNGLRIIALNAGLYPWDSKVMARVVIVICIVLFVLHFIRALENFTGAIF